MTSISIALDSKATGTDFRYCTAHYTDQNASGSLEIQLQPWYR